jgi:hypothetical protein
MKQDTAPTRVTVAADPRTDLSPADRLLRTLQSSLAGQFELFGELGRGSGGRIVYLAREIASGRLVALQLTPTGTKTVGGEDYWFEILRTLDANVPAPDSDCPRCHKPLGGWGRYCRHCGVDLSGIAAGDTPGATDHLLRDVRAAARGRYDVLGQMDRTEGGGTVYFARELATGKLVALRVQREPGGEHGTERYNIGVTGILKPALAAALGVGGEAAPKKTTVPTPAQAAETVVARPINPVPVTPPAPRQTAPVDPVKATGITTTRPWRPNRDQAIAIASGVIAVIALIWLAIARTSRDGSTDNQPPIDSTPPITSTMIVVDSGEVQVGGRLPAGSIVRVDGAPVSGRTFRVTPGTHTFELRAPGYSDARQEVTVRAKQNLVWTPQMIRVTEAGGSIATPSHRTTTPPARSVKPPANQRSSSTPRIDSSPPVSVAVTQRADSSKPSDLTDISAVSCGSLFARLEWSRALVACEDEAKRGSVVAQRTVGTIYERGLGVNPNAPVAAQWYTKAADGGDAVAQFRLGSMLYSGTGIKKNEKMGITWLRRAADQQQLDAMYALAQALERGEGVKKNQSEALALFTRAAELGYPRAQTKLGSLHAAGDIVVHDDKLAVAWFRKAADQGFAEAQYRLGDMYARGVGVPRSDDEAKRWFTLAAAQGHERAQKALRK